MTHKYFIFSLFVGINFLRFLISCAPVNDEIVYIPLESYEENSYRPESDRGEGKSSLDFPLLAQNRSGGHEHISHEEECFIELNEALRGKHRELYEMEWSVPPLYHRLRWSFLGHNLPVSLYVYRILDSNGGQAYTNPFAHKNLYNLMRHLSSQVMEEAENQISLENLPVKDLLPIQKLDFCSDDEWRNYTSLYLKNMFFRLVLATAWKESRWRHYSAYYGPDEDNRVLTGDQNITFGHASYGIMQIYSEFHGVQRSLEKNLEVGIVYLHESFSNALQLNDPTLSCRGLESSNAQKGEIGVLRRSYSGYNTGTLNHGSASQGVCRDGDPRDDNFVEIYIHTPWRDYFQDLTLT